MLDTGVVRPTTATTEGVGLDGWTNASNAIAEDTAVALAGGFVTDSKHLILGGFDFSDIPHTADIKGIVAVFRKKGGNGLDEESYDSSVRLRPAGTAAGDNKADTLTMWISDFFDATYGANNDTWGLTGITASDLKHPDFAVAIARSFIGIGGGGAAVDSMYLTVYYELRHTGIWQPSPLGHTGRHFGVGV